MTVLSQVLQTPHSLVAPHVPLRLKGHTCGSSMPPVIPPDTIPQAALWNSWLLLTAHSERQNSQGTGLLTPRSPPSSPLPRSVLWVLLSPCHYRPGQNSSRALHPAVENFVGPTLVLADRLFCSDGNTLFSVLPNREATNHVWQLSALHGRN